MLGEKKCRNLRNERMNILSMRMKMKWFFSPSLSAGKSQLANDEEDADKNVSEVVDNNNPQSGVKQVSRDKKIDSNFNRRRRQILIRKPPAYIHTYCLLACRLLLHIAFFLRERFKLTACRLEGRRTFAAHLCECMCV